MEYVDALVRFLHIISAIGLVGGTLFCLAAMRPAVRLVDDSLQESIIQMTRKRFMRIVHPSLFLLLVTGLVQFMQNLGDYKNASKAVHAVLGIKILLALIVMGIIYGQAAKVIKGDPWKWSKVNLTLGVIIVLLAAVARQIRLAGV